MRCPSSKTSSAEEQEEIPIWAHKNWSLQTISSIIPPSEAKPPNVSNSKTINNANTTKNEGIFEDRVDDVNSKFPFQLSILSYA